MLKMAGNEKSHDKISKKYAKLPKMSTYQALKTEKFLKTGQI